MRVGFGVRHPRLAELLAISEPAAAPAEVEWFDGALKLRVTGYTTPTELPDELVTSVRCVVEVGERIVLCLNADGYHMWPGGHREPGESIIETASREVHEETGWLIDVDTVRPLGWLHHEHIKPVTKDHPYPHPDFLHPVLLATAVSRDGDGEWTDTEGYEFESRLVPIAEARQLIASQPTPTYATQKAFLDRLEDDR